MKKYDFLVPALFIAVVTMIVIIPLGLFIFSELLGYKNVNELLKDHGSLFAGVLAVLAVAVTITYQNINTTKQIQAQNNLSEKNRLIDKQEEVIELLAASSNTLSKMIDAYGKKIKPEGFVEKDLWSDYVMRTSIIYSLVRKYNLSGINDAYELMSLASLASFLANRIYYVDSLGLADSKSTKDFMGNLLEASHSARDGRDVSEGFYDLIQYIVNTAYFNQRRGNDLILLTSLLEKMILNLILSSDKLQNQMVNQ